MASFSDDEQFEIDEILQQRKRKGALEYLVRWKGDENEQTWEPAKRIAEDCASAIKTFLQQQKAKKSKSKKSSVSRSRSRSRSRKQSSGKAGSKSRSRSRGRSTAEKKEVAAKTTKAAAITTKEAEKPTKEAAVKETKAAVVEEVKTTEEAASERASRRSRRTIAVTSSEIVITESSISSKETSKTDVLDGVAVAPLKEGRVLRSSTMASKEKLEVQRVHNEQRPVHPDENKPRSCLWKIADYAVIVLFILSLIAALFLFVEKFYDLEDFKKQFMPNLTVLRRRLISAQGRLVDLFTNMLDYTSDAWVYILEQVRQPETAEAPPSAAAGGK